MSLNPIPSNTASLPALTPKNPPLVKSKITEMAEANLEIAAQNKERHKKIKLKAMAQVTVWNCKQKVVVQSPEHSVNPLAGAALCSTISRPAAQQASAVAEVKSSRDSVLQFHAFQQSASASVHILRKRQKVVAAQQPSLNSQQTLAPVLQARVERVEPAVVPTADHALCERYQESPFLIGKGTIGTIMRGYDLVSRSHVAIKKAGSAPGAYRAIVHESKVLQELERRHAPHSLHIRAAFDRSSSEGIKEYVMVTDWIPVRNMYENYLNSTTHVCSLNYFHIFSLGKQLLEYLAALSPDLIHGDLAPVNLIYEIDCCHLTVLDNSLSRKVNDKTDQLIQSSYYRCPEAILKGPLDCSADIWSVACILFELITGKPLFPVYDHKTDLTISSNELLQRMFLQIGLPSQQFLEKCTDASKYYVMNKSQVHFHRYFPIPYHPWREAILTAARPRGMSLDLADGFIHLLEGMLKYENRPSASELLRSPLFETGISFHLGPVFRTGDVITIYRAWDMHRHLEAPAAIPFPFPFFRLNHTHTTLTCLHIPLRDPQDQYIVYLSREGLTYPAQCRSLKQGETLDFDLP